MAERTDYKSKYTGAEVDKGIDYAYASLRDDSVVQSTGPNQSKVMSQGATTIELNKLQQQINETNINILSLKQTLYANKVDNSNATLNITQPDLSESNIMISPATTNTDYDWDNPVYSLSYTLGNNITLSSGSSMSFNLPFKVNRNAEISWGTKIKVSTNAGVSYFYVSTNQAYGSVYYSADVGNSVTLTTYFNLLSGPTVYGAGTIIVFEIYRKQDTSQSLTSNLYCGVDFDGSAILTYSKFDFSSVELTTGQIADNSVTYNKLSLGVQNDINMISNPNLVINGGFRVNQRGLNSYTGYNKPCLDRWVIYANNTTITPTRNGVDVSTTGGYNAGVLVYYVPKKDVEILKGKTVTLSMRGTFPNNTMRIRLITNQEAYNKEVSGDITALTIGVPSDITDLKIYIGTIVDTASYGAVTGSIEYVKLELGDKATPYKPLAYFEELSMCQTPDETGVQSTVATTFTNPNILINGDFRINQRGQTTYSSERNYSVDRWFLAWGTLVVNANGSVTHSSNDVWQGIWQFIERPSRFAGKNVTLSASVANVTREAMIEIKIQYGNNPDMAIAGVRATRDGIISCTATIPEDITDNDKLFITLWTINANESVTWNWAKLEVGNIATPFSPKTYAEELANCQRYFQNIYIQGTSCAPPATQSSGIYCGIPLTATIRTKPTISRIISYPKVRGNGSTINSTAIRVEGIYDNLLSLQMDFASNLSANQSYMLMAGEIMIDAEIY